MTKNKWKSIYRDCRLKKQRKSNIDDRYFCHLLSTEKPWASAWRCLENRDHQTIGGVMSWAKLFKAA